MRAFQAFWISLSAIRFHRHPLKSGNFSSFNVERLSNTKHNQKYNTLHVSSTYPILNPNAIQVRRINYSTGQNNITDNTTNHNSLSNNPTRFDASIVDGGKNRDSTADLNTPTNILNTMDIKMDDMNILSLLRKDMRELDIDGIVITDSDQHHTEYSHESEKRRSYVSNFTGSNGIAFVTSDRALLWTDGRYFLQAERELSSDWTLMKMEIPNVPSLKEYIRDSKTIKRIGVDAYRTSMLLFKELQEAGFSVKSKKNTSEVEKEIVFLLENPVDKIWGKDRPASPNSAVYHLDSIFTGMTTTEKLKLIFAEMEKEKTDIQLLSSFDDVAWLTNLRGSDIFGTPLFTAYGLLLLDFTESLMVENGTFVLYVDQSRFQPEALKYTIQSNTKIRPYDSLTNDLRYLVESKLAGKSYSNSVAELIANDGMECMDTNHRTSEKDRTMVWLDPGVNAFLYEELSLKRKVVLKPTSATQLKSKKNTVEIQGMRVAHELDGVALVTFFAWLDKQLEHGDIPLDEWSLKLAVEASRSFASNMYCGPSFETISSIGPNSAVVHYRPTIENAEPVPPKGSSDKKSSIFLLDSGGQYYCGTTDVTRTIHLHKNPTEEEKRSFTLVLKGNIALSQQHFPKGVRGPQIDAIARQFLWNSSLDYLHGTGHGVGSFLNVHEGPIAIGSRLQGLAASTDLEPGNVVSIEPGLYLEGSYGIRIENLAAIMKLEAEYKGRYFMDFETLTMCPLDRSLIATEMLSPSEKKWIDEYHEVVLRRISPRLINPKLNSLDSFKGRSIENYNSLDIFTPPVEGAVSVSMKEALEWLNGVTRPLDK